MYITLLENQIKHGIQEAHSLDISRISCPAGAFGSVWASR